LFNAPDNEIRPMKPTRLMRTFGQTLKAAEYPRLCASVAHWVVLLPLSLAGFPSVAFPGPPQAAVDFQREVRPILADACFQCHGPDPQTRRAKLRLDTRVGAFAQREGPRVLVPGHPERSELIRRITSSDPTEVMPPLKQARRLKAAEIDLLRRWIEQGAPWQMHWAFVPPRRPALPALVDPSWPRNALDRFILARLEAEGLRPSPEADQATLIRRVTLDLTGLPPTFAEVEAFRADRAPDAYERVVDRLLQSPRYGERQASDWLDAARYADSNGYSVDRDREMWPWRDWVIAAFNRNLPFDQFTILQLAGDLLPKPTLEQRIATGFHRNHMFNEEGGVIPEEFLAEYAADRVETTATVWLGLTLGCARCHDHKYDPLAQKEFYRLAAFFRNVPEKGRGQFSAPFRRSNPPFLELPAPELEARLAKLRQELQPASDAIERARKEIAATQADWEHRVLDTAPLKSSISDPGKTVPADVRTILRTEPGKRSAADQEKVREYRLAQVLGYRGAKERVASSSARSKPSRSSDPPRWSWRRCRPHATRLSSFAALTTGRAKRSRPGRRLPSRPWRRSCRATGWGWRNGWSAPTILRRLA
jgi:mono/diheme cytochrome c family protein